MYPRILRPSFPTAHILPLYSLPFSGSTTGSVYPVISFRMEIARISIIPKISWFLYSPLHLSHTSFGVRPGRTSVTFPNSLPFIRYVSTLPPGLPFAMFITCQCPSRILQLRRQLLRPASHSTRVIIPKSAAATPMKHLCRIIFKPPPLRGIIDRIAATAPSRIF